MTFQPFVPWPLLAVLAAGAVLSAVVRWRHHHQRTPIVRSMAMCALALLASANPIAGGESVAARTTDADVLFIVDATGSVGALDYNGDHPRLDGVRADILELVGEFPGAHFSLISFDSDASVVVPWTTDVGALESAVSVLRQERTIYARGTDLGVPRAAITGALPRTDDSQRYEVVFYFSDGEQTVETDPESFREFSSTISGGAVLGYGTAEGARIPIYVSRDRQLEQYIHDNSTGTDAVSRIDEDRLRSIATDLGVPYVHRTGPGGLDEVAAGISDRVSGGRGDREGARHWYWLAAFGLVALVLWQFATTSMEIAEARRTMSRPTRRLIRPGGTR